LSEADLTVEAVQLLRQPTTIRTRCHAILAAAEAGRSAHFRVERAALGAVAERVAALTRQRFPDLRIPYHSRWRHFEVGGIDRKAELDARLAGASVAELACARIDLTLISVLLDAGAGPDWRYQELETGQAHGRSEGLAVASFRAFLAGAFSSVPAEPCRVDAAALLALDEARLAALFQVGPANPLVGLAGRVELLHRLGAALQAQPGRFGAEGRPGRLYDLLAAKAADAPAAAPAHQGASPAGHQIRAAHILGALLDAFSAIWPSGQWLGGLPLGDAWPHPAAGGEGLSAGWVPFHKLSQWLSYSLLEPFEWAGIEVTQLDELTGLPEYRNGGLLLDAGVLCPLDPDWAGAPRTPADPWVIEWRALTVALLDELAPRVRECLQVTAAALPLARILEGGTWAAGRRIAAERRPAGSPPLAIDSDGTVF
jgi:hypothetical protein